MDFKRTKNAYRPLPFWSWNERLDTAETSEQIRKMHEVGIGGFFMHARGGLQTEYMGEEWFANVQESLDTAKALGMRPWVYDENGWPSGFGDGAVPALGIKYQQKFLRMESEPTHPEAAIAKCGEHYFYYEVNPHYVDNLDYEVVAKFIEVAYEPYYRKFGNAIEGFFTDEPQLAKKGLPWSFVFEAEYLKRYGEPITERLEELFLPVGEYKNTRVRFWKMVTDLFSSAYMKQIYEWCDNRGLKLTGHLVREDNYLLQINSSGACMPHYEYFHIPGMDWLGRSIVDCLTPYQVSSVAQQLGKRAVISESFALCGHNVSFDELKGIYEWQAVRGINLLCQHLQGYSLRGKRKRDFPPAMYFQQPWWSEYRRFNDALSRIGMILQNGRISVDTLVINPITTAWSLYDGDKNEGVQAVNDTVLATVKTLEKKHIQFHLGDETIMERHARVENGKIVIGEQSYTQIITYGCDVLLESTQRLLDEFVKTGGKTVTADDLAPSGVCDNERITYTYRVCEGYIAHYFVNTSQNTEQASIAVNGKALDIYTGELCDFSGNHTFEPWGSLMIIDDGSRNVSYEAKNETELRLNGRFTISGEIQNCLTLDRCDYYFDGELQERDGYVLNIAERANLLERPVRIRQHFRVSADYIPTPLYLVCETPEIFSIRINGNEIDKQTDGYFIDKSFNKIEVGKYFRLGENEITLECDFEQSMQFYESHRRAFTSESERNKLVYDMEIEPLYLVGDFTVKTDGEWTELDKNASRYRGNFALDMPKSEIELKHIERQGYPFFCGEMTVTGELEIVGDSPVLVLDRKGINAVRVEIAGKERVIITGNKIPLGDIGIRGKTPIKLTLINNLRNLLGPHHLDEGESYRVRPSAFYKEKCVWHASTFPPKPIPLWHDDYCFAQTSI